MAGQVSNVLRIPRSDAKGSFVLARMASTGPASRPLNGKVVATEGMAPYVLALRHDKIDRLRADKAPCSPDEWERILVFLLLGQGAVANIEAAAVVQEEKELTISIQRRVESITQRLGTLSLVHDEDEGIELFDWCGEAVQGRAAAQEALVNATAKEAELEKLVAELKDQLDEFMAVKAEEEKVLLEKFCTLLNEKKVKIRVQQRALEAQSGQASSRVKIKDEDEETDESMQDVRAEIKEEEEDSPPASATIRRTSRAPPRKVGAVGLSRAAKRGAKRPAAASDEDESSSDDGFEQAAPGGASRKDKHGHGEKNGDDDEEGDDNDDDSEEDDDAQTTDEDDSTQSEDEGEDEPEAEQARPLARRNKPAAKGKGRAANKGRGKGAAQPAQGAAAPEAVEAPPPRRELVFGRARQDPGAAKGSGSGSNSNSNSRKAAKPEESDTDSDDEL